MRYRSRNRAIRTALRPGAGCRRRRRARRGNDRRRPTTRRRTGRRGCTATPQRTARGRRARRAIGVVGGRGSRVRRISPAGRRVDAGRPRLGSGLPRRRPRSTRRIARISPRRPRRTRRIRESNRRHRHHRGAHTQGHRQRADPSHVLGVTGRGLRRRRTLAVFDGPHPVLRRATMTPGCWLGIRCRHVAPRKKWQGNYAPLWPDYVGRRRWKPAKFTTRAN